MAIWSKCANNEYDIPDKSIASDPNQTHFRLALSIQWRLVASGDLNTYVTNLSCL